MSIDRPDYSRITDVIRFDTGVQQRQNLILNGSFETGDFSNWWPTGNVSIDTTLILHGRYSCRLAPVASNISQLLPPWYADHCKFSFWMYNSIIAANMLQVNLGFADGTSETHNITPTLSDAFRIYTVESDTHKQLCRITFLHNHATDILYLEGISGVLKDRPVTPTPGSEIEITQDTAEDLNAQAIMKPISCADVHEQYAKGFGDSPVTMVSIPDGKRAVIYYYTIWNNDDTNDADVALYIGADTCPLYSGQLDPDCGVIANLVRPVRGNDGADVILTIAGSTDVDCVVHVEVAPFADCPWLEGDYSDWAIYDSFDDVTMYVGDWENAALFNRLETVAVLIDANVCKKYTIATKTLGGSLFDPSILSGGFVEMGLAIRSVLGTYVVSIDDTNDNLYILKNGDIVKTMTYTDLGLDDGRIRSVSISPSGKYIAVSGTRTATGNVGWVILVGS